MTTYLSRPVFDFVVDWKQQPAKSFTYDLRALNIGFGAPRFAPLQSYVTHGLEFLLELLDENAIADFEEFGNAVKGRLSGFWLPDVTPAFVIEATDGARKFWATGQDLYLTWDKHPSQYIIFRKKGEADRIAKIAAVSADDDREYVQMAADVDVDETWQAFKLLYGRFASDKEEIKFRGEQVGSIKIKFVELPTEYTAVETGEQPVYFFRFFYGGPGTAPSADDFYCTSFQTNLASTYGGTTTAKTHLTKPINHGALRDTIKGDRVQLTIDALYETATPFAQFFPMTLLRPLWVELRSAQFATPNTTTLLFTGQVMKAPLAGRKLQLQCASLLDALGNRFPHFAIASFCQYQLYDAATCKVNKTFYDTEVTVVSIDGKILVVAAAALAGKPVNWFANSALNFGTGAAAQVVMVQASGEPNDDDEMAISLSTALAGLEVGDELILYAGCDRTPGSRGCAKFSNIVNFGGHPHVPQINLSLKAPGEANTAMSKKGGKK